MTRSSANWTANPGGYDALHCERHIWPSDSPHGIPNLQPQTFDLPPDVRLLPYRSRLDRNRYLYAVTRGIRCGLWYVDEPEGSAEILDAEAAVDKAR